MNVLLKLLVCLVLPAYATNRSLRDIYNNLSAGSILSGSSQLTGHTDTVNSVAFTLDGKSLVSGSNDRSVRVWDIEREESIISHSHADSVGVVACIPNGRCIASGSDDMTVQIWDTQAKQSGGLLRSDLGRVDSIACNPDGRYLAVGTESGSIGIWDIRMAKCLDILHGSGERSAIAYSSDGRYLVNGSWTDISLWDFQTGVQSDMLTEGLSLFYSVAYSPDNKYLASAARKDGCSESRSVYIWSMHTGMRIARLKSCNDEEVNSLAYNPIGMYLSSGSEDGAVRIWDTQNKKLSVVLKGHNCAVNSVAYSPDGNYLASGSSDTTICIWDVKRLNVKRFPLCVMAALKFIEQYREGSEDYSRTLKRITENDSVMRLNISMVLGL